MVLSTNVLFGVQSLYMKEGGLTGMYYDYAMAAPLMVPDKPVEDMDVLILGMGTGTYATQCRKYFGDMNIEGVEIDEKITELSREYFSLPEDVKVYLDVSLKRFETVFPAAGSSNSAVEMTCDELERYASNFAAWVDVCKGWRPEEQG